jgi:hypothetical protein
LKATGIDADEVKERSKVTSGGNGWGRGSGKINRLSRSKS